MICCSCLAVFRVYIFPAVTCILVTENSQFYIPVSRWYPGYGELCGGEEAELLGRLRQYGRHHQEIQVLH